MYVVVVVVVRYVGVFRDPDGEVHSRSRPYFFYTNPVHTSNNDTIKKNCACRHSGWLADGAMWRDNTRISGSGEPQTRDHDAPISKTLPLRAIYGTGGLWKRD